MTPDHAARLGRLVRARRRTLRLTQAAIQEAGGPSTATLRLIEGGRHTEFRNGTADQLERTLRWQPGSIAAMLRGGDPIEVEPAPVEKRPTPRTRHWLDDLSTAEIIDRIRVLFAELRDRVPTGGAVDKAEDWPEPFFEGTGDKAPPVSRRQNGDDGNELWGG